MGKVLEKNLEALEALRSEAAEEEPVIYMTKITHSYEDQTKFAEDQIEREREGGRQRLKKTRVTEEESDRGVWLSRGQLKRRVA